MIYEVIDAKKVAIPVGRGCRLFGVSMSGYYAWKTRWPSKRQYGDMVLLAHIRNRFTLSHETYGSPRLHADLRAAGITGGRHRIARIMRDNGLKALQKRRYKKTTDSDHGGPVAPNVLDQDFTAEAPNQKWGVDISYIWTAEGWLYLAVVVDLFSRRIIGWAVSDRMKKGLAMTALKRAIVMRRPPKGVIHHSDRGSQYCSTEYQKILTDNEFVISMSGKGSPGDFDHHGSFGPGRCQQRRTCSSGPSREDRSRGRTARRSGLRSVGVYGSLTAPESWSQQTTRFGSERQSGCCA